MNQDVNVISYYFTPNHCFPRQVEINGRQLNLETGLRCLVQKGKEFLQIFNMTDGHSLYRLSFEPASRTWKLLSSRSL